MKCHWEEIDSFRSHTEFTRFITWIDGQVRNGNATEVTSLDYSAGKSISERQFVCMECQSIWRLMYPDPGYFAGAFLCFKSIQRKLTSDTRQTLK